MFDLGIDVYTFTYFGEFHILIFNKSKVIGANICISPLLPIVMQYMGLFGTIVHFFFSFVCIFQLCVWLLLFHLSYYSLSYRIQVLLSSITHGDVNHHSHSILPYKKMKGEIRTCAYIFDKICLAASELNATFSLSVLIILTVQMILSSTSLFLSIFVVSLVVDEALYGSASLFVSSFVVIAVILKSADSPIEQVFNSLLTLKSIN